MGNNIKPGWRDDENALEYFERKISVGLRDKNNLVHATTEYSLFIGRNDTKDPENRTVYLKMVGENGTLVDRKGISYTETFPMGYKGFKAMLKGFDLDGNERAHPIIEMADFNSLVTDVFGEITRAEALDEIVSCRNMARMNADIYRISNGDCDLVKSFGGRLSHYNTLEDEFHDMRQFYERLKVR